MIRRGLPCYQKRPHWISGPRGGQFSFARIKFVCALIWINAGHFFRAGFRFMTAYAKARGGTGFRLARLLLG
jgi:hypothetical protein